MNSVQKQIIIVGILLVFAVGSCLRCGDQAAPPSPEQKRQHQTKDYLETYSQAAMREMRRSGVPASITLAQGILESGYGQSGLAKNAFNHFGIKCGKDWKGDKYCAQSDEWSPRQKKMIKKLSCFRWYQSAEESYRDHSDFLKNRPRYADLFRLDPDDYAGWAHGLQKAGYATDPEYGNKLVSLIERYQLQQFDVATLQQQGH